MHVHFFKLQKSNITFFNDTFNLMVYLFLLVLQSFISNIFLQLKGTGKRYFMSSQLERLD